jgi:hypothetical protein
MKKCGKMNLALLASPTTFIKNKTSSPRILMAEDGGCIIATASNIEMPVDSSLLTIAIIEYYY